MTLPASSSLFSISTFCFPYSDAGRSGVSSVQNLSFSPTP